MTEISQLVWYTGAVKLIRFSSCPYIVTNETTHPLYASVGPLTMDQVPGILVARYVDDDQALRLLPGG